ncbi:MAG: ECF transporter S component [Desulfurococcaceae archaeon]
MKIERYTMIDLLVLGATTAIFAVVFISAWTVYYAVKAIGGPIIARIATYGMWFMPAPLVASILRKRLSAFLGEFLPALLESILPTPGGLTNALYGFFQGLFSELAYLLTGYRKYNVYTAIIAGALPTIPAITLDALLFEEIYPFEYMGYIIVAVAISGAIYGALAYYVARSIRR